MSDHHDLPFKAEYAKSGRASCKFCKSPIAKDSLRLAIMVQSPMFDGKVPNWFHFSCFWKRARVQNATEIHGIDAIRWEDQEKVKKNIAGGGAAGGGGGGGGEGDAAVVNYKDFNTEYAKSNRSTCRGCEDKIAKDEVRVSRKEFDSQRAKMYGPQDQWYHVQCFVENRDDLEFTTDMQPEKIPGYTRLKKEDKEDLLEKLGKGSAKKRKPTEAAAGGSGAKKAKKETAEEKALREQNQSLWKIRDTLSKEVANNALKVLLEYNKQNVPSGESKLLDRVCDCMAFGAIKPCPECKNGQLAYSGDGYRCTGNLTEWTKCMYITQKPVRKNFKIPEEFHDVDILKNYQPFKKNRVFPKVTAASTSGAVSSGSKPLEGMKFVILKTAQKKGDITAEIERLGGELVTKIDKSVMACISTKENFDKGGKKIKDAEKADVHVITEDYLEAAKKGGAALLIKQHSLSTWGADPHSKVDIVDGPTKSGAFKSMISAREERMFTKSVPQKRKVTVKGGAAVDPDSGLEAQAHVLLDNGAPLDAVLGLVDIVKGTNSFYKLQCIESDKSQIWWVFRAWGRVGTTIGGNKVERCGSRASAIGKFMELYGEKTGNDWADRKNFVKHPNRFYPLEIDYGGDDEELKKLDMTGTRSTLKPQVQDLIRMIFDVESMKKAMLEFEIDLKKMPLGKLTKNQIEQAYKVLTELTGLIASAASTTAFLDASNRFYTLIPHDFGMKKPPLLDTDEIIKSKTEMLNNLIDIEVAYNMLKSADDDGKDPLDVHYEKLKSKIQPVDKSSDEYTRLLDYVKNTHAATHNYYDLEVEEIFALDREGEKKRFKPFMGLGNRKLLWHGSGVTNYAGILSQGLRIAPPEAPVTGYMFGKGVYFADMVSKSANYCRASMTNPVGLLLLCDVALGNMYELTGAQYVSKLPKGMHSTKGQGMTTPDPAQAYTNTEGVEIPMGPGMKSNVAKSSLLYNEYIVYDTAQVRMKYLLKTRFKYKSGSLFR